MAHFAFEDFRGDVVGGAANGLFLFAFKLKAGGQAKITQLDLHLVVEKEVAQLEVSVDHAVGNQILKTLNNLDQVALNFQFCEALTPF